METEPGRGMDTMTEAKILEAIEESLRAAHKRPEGALSVSEIVDETGHSKKEVREHLRRLKQDGRLQVHVVRKEALDGSMRPVPVYEILEP